MIYKYLDVIDDTEFSTLSSKERDQYLFEKKLFISAYKILNPTFQDSDELGKISMFIELCEENRVYKPSEELREDFYAFVTHKYKSAIGYAPIMFRKEFSAKTFGIKSKKKVRSLALKEFNLIFEKYCVSTYHLSEGRFYGLSQTKASYVEQLSNNRNLLYAYLLGKEDVFNRSLYQNTPLLIEIMDFEGHLEVLISLNQEYEFEEDKYFVPQPRYLLLFEAMDSKIDIKVTRFIDYFVSQISEKHHSYLTVLYRFLKDELNLDINEKSLNESFKVVYNINVGRLKISDKFNLEFRKRLKKCKEKWDTFNNLEG